MAEILIFSGTTEGRELAEALCARQIDCMASVATEYGREVMRQQEHLVIREGRMGEPEMEELMRTGAFLAVVDATHPYAVEVTEHIKESAKKTNLPYLRLSRSTAAEREIAEHEWMIHTVADTQECVELLSKLPGNILLTTGSKELHAYAAREEIRKRLFVRVLPGVESIDSGHATGYRTDTAQPARSQYPPHIWRGPRPRSPVRGGAAVLPTAASRPRYGHLSGP